MLWGAYVGAEALPKNLQNTPHKQPIMKKRQVCQHIDWLKIEDYCHRILFACNIFLNYWHVCCSRSTPVGKSVYVQRKLVQAQQFAGVPLPGHGIMYQKS